LLGAGIGFVGVPPLNLSLTLSSDKERGIRSKP